MRGPALYVVVALSGASVLALEILGTRILGPFYGVSLYLWSALISVTLAALSVGYVLGGRWADRGPSARRLALVLSLAGAWTLLIPVLRSPLLQVAEGLGLRATVLVAATGLFFVPLGLLGMVSPYAIRLRANALSEVGQTAGNIFAVSTVASVAAAVLTGFWLIPNFGVLRLTTAIGLALWIAAAIALLQGGAARSRGAVAAGLVGLVTLGSLAFARSGPSRDDSVLHIQQSPYAEIRVVDADGLRYLLIDGGVHSVVTPGTWDTHHPYVVLSELAKELFPRPGRMLLVGLGGGSAVKTFTRDDWRVESIEIDPVVTQVAYDYFGLEPEEVTVHHGDGRRHLVETDETYDIVFLDAFGSSSIPFHLVTTEVFALIRDRLAPDGLLVMNVEAIGWHHPLIESLGNTLKTQFPHVLALPIAEPPSTIGNVILFASDREMVISDEALGRPLDFVADPYEHWRVIVRNHGWDNRFVPGTPDAPVLTDDRNPVDLWAEAINLEARGDLHALFEKRGVSW